MRRLDALNAIYSRLEHRVVVTIMGAVAAELQSIGHRPNFFYLQHAMGLASSMGLGIALTRPDRQVVVFDGDGSILMNLGGLTTLARYRPGNLVHVVFDNESLLSVGGFPTATRDRQRHRCDRRGRRGAEHHHRSNARRFHSRFRRGAVGWRADDDRGEGGSRRPEGIRHRPVFAREPVRISAISSRGTQLMNALLTQVADALSRGTMRVVDLTQPLGPATPVIGLPPIFAASPGVTIDVISEYDEQRAGVVLEHASGGRAYRHAFRRAHSLDHRQGSARQRLRLDSRAAGRPACVIDVTKDVQANLISCSPAGASKHGSASTAGYPVVPGS